MGEWSTYGLEDFLLFSPRTYFRLVELYNQAIWPGQLAAIGMGLAVLWLLVRPAAWSIRLVPAILAVAWGWVAWAWFSERYATINWAANYLAGLFAIQAILLALMALSGGRTRALSRPMVLAALPLLMLGLVIYPFISLLVGRDWNEAEVFALMPDPTAAMTVGALLVLGGWRMWIGLAIPLLASLAGAATLLAMDEPHAIVMFIAASYGAGIAVLGTVRRSHERALNDADG